jgi:hypothetical protein
MCLKLKGNTDCIEKPLIDHIRGVVGLFVDDKQTYQCNFHDRTFDLSKNASTPHSSSSEENSREE